MSLYSLRIEILWYFIVIAKEGNLSKAAVHLKVAQPALSRYIQELEKITGTQLLHRNSRGISLTSAGKIFLEEAKAIVNQVSQAETRIQSFITVIPSTLNVGYAPSLTNEIISTVLPLFLKNEPTGKVHLHDLSGLELLSQLRSEQLDFCLMQRPHADLASGLIFETIITYRICVAVSVKHRLAKASEIPLEELRSEKLVMYEKENYPDYHRMVHRVFAERQLPEIALECNSNNSVMTAVQCEIGVAILPEIASKINTTNTRIIPLQTNSAPLEVGICRLENKPLSLQAETFCSYVRKHKKSLSKSV